MKTICLMCEFEEDGTPGVSCPNCTDGLMVDKHEDQGNVPMNVNVNIGCAMQRLEKAKTLEEKYLIQMGIEDAIMFLNDALKLLKGKTK